MTLCFCFSVCYGPPRDGGTRVGSVGGQRLRTRSNGCVRTARRFTDRLVRKFRLPGQRVARTVVLAESVSSPLGASAKPRRRILNRGFTVRTGETGTGKTGLLRAFAPLGGARADATRVRSGAGRSGVKGASPQPSSATAWPQGRRCPRVVGRTATTTQRHRSASVSRDGGLHAPTLGGAACPPFR